MIEDDAGRLPRLLAERGHHHADIVISSLPWTVFPATSRTRIMDAVLSVLHPHSVFTTFSYLHARPIPAARAFRTAMARHFEEVIPGRTVWRNLPPAYLLHGLRPRPRPTEPSTPT